MPHGVDAHRPVSTEPRSTQQQLFEAELAPILSSAFALAWSLARDRDEAEDVVQDASLQAYRAFSGFLPGSNFRAWFFRILTNAYRQRRRAAGRRPLTTSIEEPEQLFLFSRATEQGWLGADSDPADLVLRKLDAEAVVRALDQLPDDFREASCLYLIAGYPYQEIADLLGCPVGTVRSRIHRGRRLLQQALWDVALRDG